MKIEVEKLIFDNGEECSYHIINIDKCCDDILHNSKYVDIIAKDNYIEDIEKDNYNVNIFNSYMSYNDTLETEYKVIAHCPFCGESIEIEFIRTINKDEEYKELTNKRDMLNIRRRKTDSKKEEQKLHEEIKELDNKINAFYESDGFDDYLERIGDM